MASESKTGKCRYCGSRYHRGWQCRQNPKVVARLNKPKVHKPVTHKPRKEIKHRPKSDRRKLIHKFDEVFSQYIRRKAESEGRLYCFVCGKKLTYETAVAMHFIGRRAISVRFNENNCKVGCRSCNAINRDQPEVLQRYAELLGADVVERLNELKRTKMTTKELEAEYEKYRSLLRDFK